MLKRVVAAGGGSVAVRSGGVYYFESGAAVTFENGKRTMHFRVRVLDGDTRNAGRVGRIVRVKSMSGRMGQALLLEDERGQFWTRSAFTRPETS